ncbi:MAG: DUF4411 family protein [Bacteroidota bacterium]
MSSFIVDANFFIQAHRVAYPMDVFPIFWEKVSELARQGKIVSLDKVRDELYKNPDELTSWCKEALPTDFFEDHTKFINEYSQIINWANTRINHYKPAALAEFLHADEADAWLIAFALNQNIQLVTHEVSAPNSKKKIKIPDVCNIFSLSYCNTIELMRQLGVTF